MAFLFTKLFIIRGTSNRSITIRTFKNMYEYDVLMRNSLVGRKLLVNVSYFILSLCCISGFP